VRIEIWSDIVCPWCYIGKRRLEKALADFPHADQVEVVWRSYQLDPSAPDVPVETVAEHLGRKYGGGPAAGRQMIERTTALAAEEGMTWRQAESLRVGTLDAHRLLHAAGELRGELKEALLHAYFAEARNVADHETLTRIATSIGLDEVLVKDVLTSDRYADEVAADVRQAAAYGATGVPFFVIDQRYGVSGAQPVDTFRQVLDRAWADTHPAIEIVSGDDADACGPDGCPI
jgi:predicted DsbA family dithiol-disulfide isomerase